MKDTNFTPIDAAPPNAGKPSSPRRIAASRANGAKSQGPKTEPGKQRSSRNAIRHGLCAANFVVENEHVEEFNKLREAFSVRFQPLDAVEQGLVDDVVQSHWMMMRARLMHNETLNIQMTMQQDELNQKFSFVSEESRITLAFHASLQESPALALLLRYETHYSRQYQRALKTLLELRKAVPIPPPDPSAAEFQDEPSPISEHEEDAPELPAAPPRIAEPTATDHPQAAESALGFVRLDRVRGELRTRSGSRRSVRNEAADRI